jgi:hypothetical protein
MMLMKMMMAMKAVNNRKKREIKRRPKSHERKSQPLPRIM